MSDRYASAALAVVVAAIAIATWDGIRTVILGGIIYVFLQYLFVHHYLRSLRSF